MRPLRLTLRAFGPFAAEQCVDFTRYGDNAFLLINGPTGAGKTSILDGICYALYGEASGAGRSEHYLRSQLALPEALCEVEFLFSVGPRIFLIKRRPAQTFLHKGAPRETIHKVEFCQVDSSGAVTGDRLTKVGEVRDRVEEVIGFSSEQFRQVVVLPQGEFRRLLLAKSDEKERILEKLFATERYKLVEESLKRKRAGIGSELKELRFGVDGILTANAAATIEELDERIAALISRRAATEAVLKQQLTAQAEAQQRFMNAQTVESLFREKELAVIAVTTLEGQQAGMEQTARRADLATRALNLIDLEENITRTEAERRNRGAALTALLERISRSTGQQRIAKETADRARQDNSTIAGLIAEKTRLEGQLVHLNELVASRTRQLAAEGDEARARQSLERQKAETAAAESRITALTTEIEQLSLGAGRVAQLDAEIVRLQHLCTLQESYGADTKSLAALSGRFSACSQELAAVETTLLAARDEQQRLQHDFIAGQATLLAAKLADGLPCPVCGSADHPHPAAADVPIPTEKDLDKALKQISALEKQQKQIAKEQNSLLAQKSGLESAVAQRLESLGEAAQLSPGDLAARLAESRHLHTAACAGVSRLQACQKEREELAGRQIELKGLLEKGEQEHSAARTGLESIRALVTQAEREAGSSDTTTVAARIAEIAAFVTRTAAALDKTEKELTSLDGQLQTAAGERTQLEQQLEQLAERLAELKQSFASRLDSEGFSSDRAYHEAKLPRQEIERIKEEVAAFRAGLAAASARRDRAEDACRDKERPDLGALKAVREAADASVAGLQQEAGLLTGQQSGLADALRTIGEKSGRITILEQQFSVTARLADLVGGQNPQRMTLQRYVLAALFEEVAIAASQRLSRMSRGRYHLVRSETARDGKTTGGLDLDVTDDYIGEKRPAFTLSGGETFLASLSLALGLSDVVMAQQGGRYLDCIFIDEGFGSLDGETLDFALNTLIELHRSGRVIGIISHVAELKERIPSRIDVIASKDGSRIVQENF